MARIPEELVRQILEKTDTLAVVQEKVRLTKKGGRWMGLCPFHSERTPSFSVDAERGLFYCFGCQKGGSIVDFVMELDKIPYREAISELARRAGIKLREESEADSAEEKEKAALYSLYEKIAGTFHWFLASHPSGTEARETLLRRGMGPALVERFRLGYAPANRRWLLGFLQSKGFSAEFLGRSGLFSANTPGFPLFADRIIFPIADQRGRVIAFGGRLLHGDGPKYINSPDTPIFRKQENLFALDRATEGIKASGKVLICEGYMDALSFHAAGVEYAVAPLGTAFTSRQAALVKRRADKVLLCFDADEAGRKAAERACAIAASVGLDSEVVRVSGGKDASEILEKLGAEALKKLPDCTINGGDFLIRRARELFDTGTVEGKAKAAAFLYPYIDALDSEVKRQAFLDIASRQLGVNPVSLQADYRSARSGTGQGKQRAQDSLGKTDLRGAVESPGARTGDLLFMTAVMLIPGTFPDLATEIAPGDLDDSRARDLFLALEEGMRSGVADTAGVLALIGDEAARRFVLSVAASGELGDSGEIIIRDGLRSVRIRSLERSRLRLLSQLAGPVGSDESVYGVQESGRDIGQKMERESGRETAVTELLAEVMKLDAELARLKGDADERS
ncbi:MAG: DNA primase [Rectinemataceae bacterium]